uniref:Protein kinase domain-containing protein n=1 Tax=Romanomermis culicivorax TaxID=13658 RepID=A0A915KC17_ROMCU
MAKAGFGGFGQVYVVRDNRHDVMCAMKVEKHVEAQMAQLPLELYILKLYQKSPHAAKLVYAGTEPKFGYIIMQLLGPNLNNLRRCCPMKCRRFSSSTMLKLAIQMIESLRDMHDCGCIHRDQKPSNYAMGYFTTSKRDTLYLIDFGLSRVFVDKDGKPRLKRNRAFFRGTTRFCSLGAHRRQDTSRSDDLQSAFYVIYDLWTGALPWSIAAGEPQIIKSKTVIPQTIMVNNLPGTRGQMSRFVEHVNSLGFYDRPNYSLLIKLLEETISELKIDKTNSWDWDNEFQDLATELKLGQTKTAALRTV